MQRITHATATVDKKFQPGNPQTGQKATVVTSIWANSIQEEIANVIEARGIDLNVEDSGQLLKAILNIQGSADRDLALLNNQVKTSMGESFLFDLSKVKSVEISADIYRTDAVVEKTALGKIILTSKPKAESCDLIQRFDFDDDHGVIFGYEIADGKCQIDYSTSNFIGANYEGILIYRTTVFYK